MFFVADCGSTVFKASLADNNGIINSEIIRIILTQPSSPLCWLSALTSAYNELDPLHNKTDCILLTGNAPTAVPVLKDEIPEISIGWNSTQNADSPYFIERFEALKNLYPKIYKKTLTILGCPEFLSFCLTEKTCASHPYEGFESFYWTKESLKENKIKENLLPPFAKAGSFLGNTTGKYSFKSGIPVLVPYPDYIPAIIGSGAVHPHILCIRSGTGDGINLCVQDKTFVDGFMTSRHPNNIDWNISCIIPDTGSSILKSINSNSLKNINQTWNEKLQNPKTIRILEKICEKEKIIIDKIKYLGIKEARIACGSLKSKFFNDMKSSYLNIPLYTTKCIETGLQGLAILAYSEMDNSNLVNNTDRIVQLES